LNPVPITELAVSGALDAAETGPVEANRTPPALRTRGLVLNDDFPEYILEVEAAFLERSGLDRTGAFRPSVEHWRKSASRQEFQGNWSGKYMSDRQWL
jgi:hypothetical protein